MNSSDTYLPGNTLDTFWIAPRNRFPTLLNVSTGIPTTSYYCKYHIFNIVRDLLNKVIDNQFTNEHQHSPVCWITYHAENSSHTARRIARKSICYISD